MKIRIGIKSSGAFKRAFGTMAAGQVDRRDEEKGSQTKEERN